MYVLLPMFQVLTSIDIYEAPLRDYDKLIIIINRTDIPELKAVENCYDILRILYAIHTHSHTFRDET